MNRRVLLLLCLGLVTAGGCVLARMSSPPPSNLAQGRLKPCPSSPNCVCSQDPNPQRRVPALAVSGSVSAAMDRLKQIISAEPRTRVVESTPEYLRVEFRSRLFGFVDDVEFLANPADQRIEVRSASRVGYSDLGVNRRRVERIRSAVGAETSR